jgi:hypothetical protein
MTEHRSAASASGRKPAKRKQPKRPEDASPDVAKEMAAANPESYKPLDMHGSSYRIRGGGSRRSRTPLLVIAISVVILAGVGILIFALNNYIAPLANEVASPHDITLTAEETRSAIDSAMPPLIEFMGMTWEGEYDYLVNDRGFKVQDEVRMYFDFVPDQSASGHLYVRVPNDTPDSEIIGYYQGTFNAYSAAELQQYLNGAWVMKDANGNLGRIIRLEYANYVGEGVEDEMDTLATLQGLSGPDVTIVYRGLDSRNNSVILGSKLIGEQTIYFKIAACPFSEVYTVDSVPSTSVYITCTVSTYDFYTGSDSKIDDYIASHAAM